MVGREITVFKGRGLYSNIKVKKRGQRVNLYTGRNFLQSTYDPSGPDGDSVLEWFLCAPIFSGLFNGNISNLLILGLGGGGAVKIYNRAYKVRGVTGVEIDPMIIELSKKYFHLNDDNLSIINDDIVNYIENSGPVFDVILLDAFKENIIEAASGSPEFLKKTAGRLTKSGVLLINRVNYKTHKSENSTLITNLKDIFASVYSFKISYNVLYIATNSLNSPKYLEEVINAFSSLADLNPELLFFKSLGSSNIKVIQVPVEEHV